MKRLSEAEALKLYQEADNYELITRASSIRDYYHPEYITYLIDRNINHTNICEVGCKFCAFYKRVGDPQGYVLSPTEIYEKIEDAVKEGATQIMLQGGLNPAVKLEYFLRLFRVIKERFPVTIHSLSPPEIDYLAIGEGLSIKETLISLQEAGLDSLPGGGAEILADRVRRIISPHKISTTRWLQIMKEAHHLGIKSTATMMLGSIESPQERIEHLDKIRCLQDETKGFRAFIPWTYQPINTQLGGEKISSIQYLRFLAISRIYLDNIENIQGSWVTEGPQIGQLSIYFGANDLGSIMLEENVVKAAGASYFMSEKEMIRLIAETGKKPALRNTAYQRKK